MGVSASPSPSRAPGISKLVEEFFVRLFPTKCSCESMTDPSGLQFCLKSSDGRDIQEACCVEDKSF